MTLESIEKLRGYANEKWEPWAEAREHLHEMLDAVEAEVAERYMELPTDADGVPIRMGDTVEGELLYDNATVKGTVTTYHIHGDNEPGTVYIKVKPTEDTWTIKELRFTRCRHVKPRTLEDVLREFTDEVIEWSGYSGPVSGDRTWSGMAVKYADEIRKILGVEQ